MNGTTFPRTPSDLRLRLEGIAMSTEIEYRISSLLVEAENRRLCAGPARDSLRRRLGRALITVGRGIEGRAAVEPAVKRPSQPAASARA